MPRKKPVTKISETVDGVIETFSDGEPAAAQPVPKRRSRHVKLYPITLTEEQRRSLVNEKRNLKPRLVKRISEVNARGTQVVGLKRDDIDELYDQTGRAAIRADDRDKALLVEVMHQLAEVMTEHRIGDFKDEFPGVSTSLPIDSRVLYQFKVTLTVIEPQIWRRIQVPNCSLYSFHNCIQAAFGWEDAHMHAFEIDGKIYGSSPYGDPARGLCDGNETYIANLISAGRKSKWIYEYDFGDGWRHSIIFEGFTSPAPKAKYPLCIAGERACPPEDCGGPWGYYRVLEALTDQCEKDAEYLEWIGSFKPEHFDLKESNRDLRRVIIE